MQTDTLIIGCGLAGATAALRLASDRQRDIAVLTSADTAIESNSRHAQGGIVTCGPDDGPELLVDDILRAGAGLSLRPAAELLAEEGPRLLTEVVIGKAGLQFDREARGGLVYGLEAAHSRRRIVHVGDTTGQAIMQALLRLLGEQPNVRLLTRHTAVDLVTLPHHALDPLAAYSEPACLGVYAFNQETGKVDTWIASRTILATGGLGQIYLNTSNPPGARGDGLAMAYRAGTRIANAEYIQFHPTTLHMPSADHFLISEAVRGEGGILLTPAGEPFMARYDPEWKDLAARDVVARAIHSEQVEHGYSHVLLDIASRRKPDFIIKRFPKIHARCLAHGLDITRQPIPVVPAAHYFCGGVLVDLWGRTSLKGLYAAGEVSCTGLHGANRLASTSLLECLVWGDRAARDIQAQPGSNPVKENQVPQWDDGGLVYDADPALIHGDLHTIRNLMWHYVGLVRRDYLLNRAIRELRSLWLNIEDFYRKTRLTDGLIGLRNSVQAAIIVAHAARHNRVSRGCHYRADEDPSRRSAPPPEVLALEMDGNGA